MHSEKPEPEPEPAFNPLAAKAATISLSAFGPGGPFGFDFFSKKWPRQNKKSSKQERSTRVIPLQTFDLDFQTGIRILGYFTLRTNDAAIRSHR